MTNEQRAVEMARAVEAECEAELKQAWELARANADEKIKRALRAAKSARLAKDIAVIAQTEQEAARAAMIAPRNPGARNHGAAAANRALTARIAELEVELADRRALDDELGEWERLDEAIARAEKAEAERDTLKAVAGELYARDKARLDEAGQCDSVCHAVMHRMLRENNALTAELEERLDRDQFENAEIGDPLGPACSPEETARRVAWAQAERARMQVRAVCRTCDGKGLVRQ